MGFFDKKQKREFYQNNIKSTNHEYWNSQLMNEFTKSSSRYKNGELKLYAWF